MKKCDCYHTKTKTQYVYDRFTGRPTPFDTEVGICWGTRECDECNCDGDRSKCDFYEHVRKEAFKPKFGEWISVDDMLPNKYGKYFVVCKDVDTAQIRLYEGAWDTIEEVTHWMPLPELPKENTK